MRLILSFAVILYVCNLPAMHLFRRCMHRTINGCYLLCALAPTIKEWNDTFFDEPNICNATCAMRRFVKQRAQKKGIMTSCAQYAYGYSSHSIERVLNIDPDLTEHDIHEILMYPQLHSDELHKHAAVIDHELTHIQKKHAQKSLASSVAIPGCALALLYALNPLKKTGLLKSCLKIPVGIFVGLSSFVAQRQIAQQQELEADEGVEDNPAVLEGMKRVLERNQALVEYAKPILFERWKDQGVPQWAIPYIWSACQLVSTHPDRATRIARVEERLTALKKDKLSEREN